MDPGRKNLENLKKSPNLVSEEPSIITPTNQTAIGNLSWKDFKCLLAKRKAEEERVYEANERRKSTHQDIDSTINTDANWDSRTGYQDAAHAPHQNSSEYP
ncbi:hypothetical protein J3Q64DRAFT_1775012 [Phycomyces blakesleeanus]|uniref:Uncharacterized protein n=2 Tax=Phycomyces blakesleeanus TaxID=4837 RepID=A0A162TE92_PHYB8|nr:hypothetical protein PHYBLDRAFT_70900 [Phycomyces blakesleeanus NRRL 1555(-)]OAD66443.1 hypothetical protein PHYBLDRAFT_70900 [Phycomyces blakesleeanus NRRL 1555(-)]|eukprot:XP_018284483.1 hypothetical protein PHYBLDRAFT_70900 [Phycomyces blakesleeanus NRRL 1555(-)]